MIKKSSMHTLPKGRMPPNKIEKGGVEYHGRLGTMRAIWFVFVGTATLSERKPKKLPTKTRGVDTHSHNPKIETRVKKLTAVAAPAMLKKIFNTIKIPTRVPGRPAAV